MSDSIDQKVQQLFNVLKEKQRTVEEAEKASTRKWKTNCSFPAVFGDLRNINIQTQKQDQLVTLLSDLLIRSANDRRAAELLGVEYDGKYAGFPVEDWIEDFKIRCSKIQLSAKKTELAELEKRLDGIVSPDQRRAMELEAITKSLEG